MMQWGPFIAALGVIGLVIVLVIVISLIIYAVFLGIALGLVNGKHRDLGTTFVTALFMSLLGWIPCLGCILSLYFIKTRHSVGWGGAFVAYILTFVIAVIVIVAILFLGFPGTWATLWSLLPF
jgi:hypothetical protein